MIVIFRKITKKRCYLSYRRSKICQINIFLKIKQGEPHRCRSAARLEAVRMKGLEPPRPKTSDPKSDAATITPHALSCCKGSAFLPIMQIKVATAYASLGNHAEISPSHSYYYITAHYRRSPPLAFLYITA